MKRFVSAMLAVCMLSAAGHAFGKNLLVAVAANFAKPMAAIAQRFEKRHQDVRIRISIGSTGQLFAQIQNGAPFDLFFAADRRRVEILQRDKGLPSNQRFTYAMGRLVLWSPKAGWIRGADALKGDFRFLVIANPKLAPYGEAAQQVLKHHGMWRSVQPRLVRAESVGQTFQFVASGQVPLGFVALSQLQDLKNKGSRWLPPQNQYQPIEQQALILTDSDVAFEFAAFVRQPAVRRMIMDFGYRLPEGQK